MTRNLLIFIVLIYVNYYCLYAQKTEIEIRPSLWQTMTYDSKYLIEDRGTVPPPRNVIVIDIRNNEIIFSGMYYQDINLRGHTIEIVKFYGEYYAGKWSINRNLEEEEMNFAKYFLETNQPPEELVRIADLAQGNGIINYI
jgi:hypothetical protein